MPRLAVVPTELTVSVSSASTASIAHGRPDDRRGEMPHLQALLAGGAHAVLRAEAEQVARASSGPRSPPAAGPGQGIRSTGARRLPGMRVPMPLDGRRSVRRALGTANDLAAARAAQPATSVLRGAKTFWNVASRRACAWAR